MKITIKPFDWQPVDSYEDEYNCTPMHGLTYRVAKWGSCYIETNPDDTYYWIDLDANNTATTMDEAKEICREHFINEIMKVIGWKNENI